MVFLRNYRFDFLHEDNNQQPYTERKGFESNLGHLEFCIKILTFSIGEFFFDFVDVQSQISLLLQAQFRPARAEMNIWNFLQY